MMLTRRLVERGVRFTQVFGNREGRLGSHRHIEAGLRDRVRASGTTAAAFIVRLNTRLLDRAGCYGVAVLPALRGRIARLEWDGDPHYGLRCGMAVVGEGGHVPWRTV